MTRMPREKCPKCNSWLEVGDWPYCGAHTSTRPERAQRFRPIVVFKRTDGTYSFPASDTAITPSGYERIEISTRRQAERLTKDVNLQLRHEKESIGPTPLDSDGSGLQNLRKLARGERVTIPDHDAHGNLILRELDGSQMRGEFKEYVAQLSKRMAANQYKPSYDPGFHLDALENDSTNRLPYDDASTGWKSRRD
jgi:hypothetical protein